MKANAVSPMTVSLYRVERRDVPLADVRQPRFGGGSVGDEGGEARKTLLQVGLGALGSLLSMPGRRRDEEIAAKAAQEEADLREEDAFYKMNKHVNNLLNKAEREFRDENGIGPYNACMVSHGFNWYTYMHDEQHTGNIEVTHKVVIRPEGEGDDRHIVVIPTASMERSKETPDGFWSYNLYKFAPVEDVMAGIQRVSVKAMTELVLGRQPDVVKKHFKDAIVTAWNEAKRMADVLMAQGKAEQALEQGDKAVS